MLRRRHPCRKAPDLVAGEELPGMAEGPFPISQGDGLLGRPRGRHGGAADRMTAATSDRRLIEDRRPVDWWSVVASGVL